MREPLAKAKAPIGRLDTIDVAASDGIVVATSGAPQSGEGREGFVPGGAVFDGRFRIEERVAEGGYAVVYKAVQVALERRVALKVLKMPLFHDERARAEFRDRFGAEAKTIALIRHPHIVDVYDFSVATLASGEFAPWMALEWLDGESLAHFLKTRRESGGTGLAARDAVDLLRPAVEALAHAHSRGIVHRDIKPANIMVVRTPKGPSVRVLDFGIAKIMSDDRLPTSGDTRTESAPAFSPFYAAPEQVTFSRTGPWTDVHALGLILTELMTGEPAYSLRDPESHVFEQVMAAVRPTPSSRGRDVGAWEPIIAKAVALSPRDRWRNAGELLAAIDQVTVARRRRVPGLAWAGGAAALVVALTLGAGARFRAVTVPPAPGLVTSPSIRSVMPPSSPIGVVRESPGAEAVPNARAAAPVQSAARATPHPTPRRRSTRKSAASSDRAVPSAPRGDPKPTLNDGSDLFDDTK